MRWLHKQETNGAMRLADFTQALKSKQDYRPEMHRFLLALMGEVIRVADNSLHGQQGLPCLQLMNENKAIVVPVLLSACLWKDEDFANLEKLPRKDELISSINPREDAWALVEEGLKRVAEKVRSSSGVSSQNVSRLAKH